MTEYRVEITDEALADMESLYSYIAYELLAPENAMNQYNRIADAIMDLVHFPERCRIMTSAMMDRFFPIAQRNKNVI